MNNVFFSKRFIKADSGGVIAVGNSEVGISKIVFKKHDLPQDMTISFQWAIYRTFDGILCSVEFGPHGKIFDKPARLELSYKNANLTGIDENNLRVFYFNQDTGIWESIGGTVDKNKKKVTVYLSHFSRYALATD